MSTRGAARDHGDERRLHGGGAKLGRPGAGHGTNRQRAEQAVHAGIRAFETARRWLARDTGAGEKYRLFYSRATRLLRRAVALADFRFHLITEAVPFSRRNAKTATSRRCNGVRSCHHAPQLTGIGQSAMAAMIAVRVAWRLSHCCLRSRSCAARQVDCGGIPCRTPERCCSCCSRRRRARGVSPVFIPSRCQSCCAVSSWRGRQFPPTRATRELHTTLRALLDRQLGSFAIRIRSPGPDTIQ